MLFCFVSSPASLPLSLSLYSLSFLSSSVRWFFFGLEWRVRRIRDLASSTELLHSVLLYSVLIGGSIRVTLKGEYDRLHSVWIAGYILLSSKGEYDESCKAYLSTGVPPELTVRVSVSPPRVLGKALPC